MSTLFVITVALAIPEPKSYPDPQIKGVDILPGYYRCEGEVGGKKYIGIVVIDRKKNVYTFQWLVGKEVYTGVGIRSDDCVCVGWAKSAMRGVASFHIVTSKKLVGEWATVPGDGEIYRESLTFLKPL
ncbi:MAG: hypothetical protein KatS3mg105_4497 [Gemmatales bacterium]|nr:MAG: hypothetical protein KatS3mg105_4497 [Gemmatales bacterium]